MGNRKIPNTAIREKGFFSTYNGAGIDSRKSAGKMYEFRIHLYKLEYDFNDHVTSKSAKGREMGPFNLRTPKSRYNLARIIRNKSDKMGVYPPGQMTTQKGCMTC